MRYVNTYIETDGIQIEEDIFNKIFVSEMKTIKFDHTMNNTPS